MPALVVALMSTCNVG